MEDIQSYCKSVNVHAVLFCTYSKVRYRSHIKTEESVFIRHVCLRLIGLQYMRKHWFCCYVAIDSKTASIYVITTVLNKLVAMPLASDVEKGKKNYTANSVSCLHM